MNAPYGNNLVDSLTSERFDGKIDLILDAKQEADFINLAIGTFSPLDGFCSEQDFNSICNHSFLTSQNLPWTVPIVLDISEDSARQIRSKSRIALGSAADGTFLGFLNVTSIFRHNKDLHIKKTFGTTDSSHPGVRLVSEQGEFLVSGRVELSQFYFDNLDVETPREIRERFKAMGLSTVAGFQTRNVVHGAHEYLQRIALEICEGLFIQPIVGWKKPGDYRREAIRDAYDAFVSSYLPPNRVVLSFLNTAMRYAGPKEAVFHAIIRKNFGCTHFIGGRDHAGVGGFYEKYASQKIFDSLPNLGIQILKLAGPFYCRKCKLIATERTCGHLSEDHQEISGTLLRESFRNAGDESTRFYRPEVVEILRKHYERGELFYD